ncbi:uncharacterized protein J4E88_006402 [Alternaria novae-zelandiae]|uniref:uncharacterized protein n=1 Tax=Alternaria novae-zelandiae TaxID=430562 RepID=UPI0020C425E9|nr:uncharacterized protein J4E88_006402 [Alternaria novae-zelandiae]KAI4679109.1 hypothetical protein J4E88_006402 [Alternaria novae-zelandiae]
MFLMSALLLLLLNTLLFATTIPRADNVEIYTKPNICLPHDGFGSRVIAFSNPHENNMFQYAVVTKYTTYYPDILKNALAVKGFQLSDLGNDQLCGWTKAAAVYSTLGLDFHSHRGDIYWKHSDAHSVGDARDSVGPSKRSANKAARLPSSIKDSVVAISTILIANPPAGDVYMFSTIILAWTTSLFGYILLMLLLMACIRKADRTTNTSKDNEVDEGIELESIKAPDTDTLARTDSAAAGPFEDVKWEYPSPQRSTDTKRVEPLPMYSLWGSGRAVA